MSEKIFRKYGTTFQSVDVDFDSKALNEVGFRRNRARAVPVEEWETSYEVVETHELVAQAEGDVQDATEQVLLDRLLASLTEIVTGLAEGEVVVIENEPGHDYPKTKQTTSNVIVAGENKLHFSYTVAPPLRVGRYRPRG